MIDVTKAREIYIEVIDPVVIAEMIAIVRDGAGDGEWIKYPPMEKSYKVTEEQVEEMVEKAFKDNMVTIYVDGMVAKRSPIQVREWKKHTYKPFHNEHNYKWLVERLKEAHRAVIIDTATYPFCESRVIYIDNHMDIRALASKIADIVDQFMHVEFQDYRGQLLYQWYAKDNACAFDDDSYMEYLERLENNE